MQIAQNMFKLPWRLILDSAFCTTPCWKTKTPCFERRIFCGHPWAIFFAPKHHWQHIGLKLLNSCNFPGSHFLSFCWLFGCEILQSGFFPGGRWFDRTSGTSFHTSFPPTKESFLFFFVWFKVGVATCRKKHEKTLTWPTWVETEIPWFFGSAFYDGNRDPIIVSASDGMYAPEILHKRLIFLKLTIILDSHLKFQGWNIFKTAQRSSGRLLLWSIQYLRSCTCLCLEVFLEKSATNYSMVIWINTWRFDRTRVPWLFFGTFVLLQFVSTGFLDFPQKRWFLFFFSTWRLRCSEYGSNGNQQIFIWGCP